jgi:hypothetical protein
MLNMFPKFELVPISRYFITFPNALRPSMMPLMEHIEALLKQDEFGCLLCHIDPHSNGDPYIGSVERGGIVDAVTQKAHYVMTLLECQNDAVLLRWRDTGKDVGRQVPEKTVNLSDRVAPAARLQNRT